MSLNLHYFNPKYWRSFFLIIVYGRISGRLYESFGVLKPRRKSFLVDNDSQMPSNRCVSLCTKKEYRDQITGATISYFRFPTKENISTREKSLYINISQGILRPCLRNRKEISIEELQEGSLDTVRTFICSIGRLHRKQRDAAMN